MAGGNRTRARVGIAVLACLTAAAITVLTVPALRSHAADVAAVARVRLQRGDAPSRSQVAGASAGPPTADRYGELRAEGPARRVVQAARSQLGAPYELGARPRHAWSLDAIGDGVDPRGFDCSTLVAFAFLHGAGIWPGGSIAHTDEIWTQDGDLPLTATAGRTQTVIRGTGDRPPPHGYRPGDLLFRRSGAGGWWGHVALVTEHGYVIEALPPDVHETTTVAAFLDEAAPAGWMRIRALDER